MSVNGDPIGSGLSAGQLQLIARGAGARSGRILADVGCGPGTWVRSLRQRGVPAVGMDEKGALQGVTTDEVVVAGSPAANVPWGAGSVDCVLFRGTRSLRAAAFDPELMIALANLGSCLKPRGTLLIPVSEITGPDVEHWKLVLSPFPGDIRVRTLKTGLLQILTLVALFKGRHQVSVVEFRTRRDPVSRLEWHRLAREAVMQQQHPPAAA